MLSLGGQVLGFSSASSSSAAKGESVSDTIRTVSCYSDIIAMRHPKEGAPLVASATSSARHQRRRRWPQPPHPDLDGSADHPPGKGRFDDLTIGLCGDLKFGRTVHSLVAAMSRYTGIRFVLISRGAETCPAVKEQYIKSKNIPHISLPLWTR